MDLKENPSEISMNESEETEALVEIPPEIEISVSDDGFIGYLRLVKQGAIWRNARILKSRLCLYLTAKRITGAVEENLADKIAAPQFGIGYRQRNTFRPARRRFTRWVAALR